MHKEMVRVTEQFYGKGWNLNDNIDKVKKALMQIYSCCSKLSIRHPEARAVF
jgi:hypothetical protein